MMRTKKKGGELSYQNTVVHIFVWHKIILMVNINEIIGHRHIALNIILSKLIVMFRLERTLKNAKN